MAVPFAIRFLHCIKTHRISLCCDLSVLALIIPAFCVHIVDHANRKQIQITDGQAKLYASEQK